MMKTVLYFTEDISVPMDEGVKKVAYSIINILPPGSIVVTMAHTSGIKSIPRDDVLVYTVSNRFMFNFFLWVKLMVGKKHELVYTPSASATLGALIKLAFIYTWFRPWGTHLILCQPKKTSRMHRMILKCIRNLSVLTLSHQIVSQYPDTDIRFVIPDIDMNKYKPIGHEVKAALRNKYRIGPDKQVILHVGHLTENRNLYQLIPLVRDDRDIVIVSSQSTPFLNAFHSKIKDDLVGAGIRIIDEYLDNIEEIYQLSDVYVFPVENQMGCIGVPLSILEALACGKDVVTTNFNNIEALAAGFPKMRVSTTDKFSDVIDELGSLRPEDMVVGIDFDNTESHFIHNNLLL